MRTVTVTELQPVVGEVVHIEEKEGAITLWFQGVRDRFSVWLPDSVMKSVGAMSVGDVVEIQVGVGRFGLKGTAIKRVTADAE